MPSPAMPGRAFGNQISTFSYRLIVVLRVSFLHDYIKQKGDDMTEPNIDLEMPDAVLDEAFMQNIMSAIGKRTKRKRQKRTVPAGTNVLSVMLTIQDGKITDVINALQQSAFVTDVVPVARAIIKPAPPSCKYTITTLVELSLELER